MSEIDKLKKGVGKRLLLWSTVSVIIGLVLYFGSSGTILGGIGLQALIWGAIDAIIAVSIVYKQKEQSIAKITKTVSASIKFDIIVQVVGLIVILVFFQDPYFVGNGIGVIIQGFFLLLLDYSYHNALRNLGKETKDVSN
ncbi:hypothetical protein EU527_01765 [Candidatus Thorarchaeota archaeon]|nr:MAG: hypothetical protein EU527_01765 [Candidatus Thorarchaeota archaeon]